MGMENIEKSFLRLILLIFNYRLSTKCGKMIKQTSYFLFCFSTLQNKNCKQSKIMQTRAFLNLDRKIFCRACQLPIEIFRQKMYSPRGGPRAPRKAQIKCSIFSTEK